MRLESLPAKAESQRFIKFRRIVFDFYPNADGLLIDRPTMRRIIPTWAALLRPRVCSCEASDNLWRRKLGDNLVFHTALVQRFRPRRHGREAAFDPRWGLIFTPHSSHFDAELMSKAKTTVFWSDATALHTPREVAAAAQTARQHRVTGFVPSLEAFSYIPDRSEAGEPWVVDKRHRPFGFDPTTDGKMPCNMLPVRVQRFAYRTYSHTPELEFAEFERQLGEHFFGARPSHAATADLLELQRIWSEGSDWYWASPLLDPAFFAAHAARLQWSNEKIAAYDRNPSHGKSRRAMIESNRAWLPGETIVIGGTRLQTYIHTKSANVR